MLLRKHSGQDFFGYKDSPVLRGIEHRMSQNRITSDEEYVALLKREPEEIDRLQRELLVGVTRFFRDKVAFTDLDGLALSTLIGGSHAQALRFWVVGCSTGEEVYSLAMLAQETHASSAMQISRQPGQQRALLSPVMTTTLVPRMTLVMVLVAAPGLR